MNSVEEGPVWQNDNDVSSCFLCSSAYHLFNRRHHCRKCGRVVCGSCSLQVVKYFPNTMIVNSEGVRSVATPQETYRTCDLCVDEIRMIRRALFNYDNGTSGDVRGGGGDSETTSTASSVRREEVQEGESAGTPANDVDDDASSLTKHTSRTTTRLIHKNKHRRHLDVDTESEENLCPVCAQDLFKLYIHEHKKHIEDITNEDFEKFKSDHVNDCLVAFDFNGDHTRMSPSKSHTRNKMLVYNIPPIPKPVFENIPNDDEQITHSGSVDSAIDKDGTSEEKRVEEELENECVICLEELKPGDKVGRLECLCVFHYKCIKDWFNKKGFGECPVHFLHK
ncbi:uncharacterized protein SPAPADRAFT_54074 [Spathaspora passalidarum NRRL Y-27907]|uniref:RING-type E3 ubiquitin transferase n=1 Tax=Spathaspora passalidarum (strain NRRL Y-27907 / 11-Y1) TaxID=619300 RepID=G3AIX6_SPAPN|nr:uncharacterized protein SPAPADRAFT_54074 [Spathaspora passalidarum NRRL Y-27907]EGW33787.1 hypothetical protein SPAPADRAFT_54074 [Spathaspora passalidarum NRRL Y-27907]